MLKFVVLSFFTLDCWVFWKGALSKVGSSLQCSLGWLLQRLTIFWFASCKQAMGEVTTTFGTFQINDKLMKTGSIGGDVIQLIGGWW